MRRTTIARLALLILILVGPRPASAGPILDLTGGLPAFTTANDSFGWAFRTVVPLAVDGLGVWDEGGNGLGDTHEVRLWSGDGSSLLASTTITNASAPVSSASPNGRWLFNDTPLLILPPGEYVLGASYANGDADFIRENASIGLTIPGVTFVEPRLGFGGLSFPGTPEPGSAPGYAPGYLGPDLRATAVPGPSGMVLLGMGLLGPLGAWWLGRARAHVSGGVGA